jgi:hypothetical protein
MATETTGLSMFSPQDSTARHHASSNSRPKSDHYDAIVSPPRTVSPLSDRGHTGIVFDGERNAKLLERPGGQI